MISPRTGTVNRYPFQIDVPQTHGSGSLEEARNPEFAWALAHLQECGKIRLRVYDEQGPLTLYLAERQASRPQHSLWGHPVLN